MGKQVAELSIVITVDGKQYAATLDQVDAKTAQFSKTAEKSAAGLSHLAGQVKALYGAFAAYGALNLVKNIVDINAEFQRLNASLVTVTGSTAAADQAFSMIEKFATTTPYQLQEVVEAFIKLKALGLDASEDSLRSYGNTASAMGKSLDQMIEAVADAATGEFERLKEFGIKASVQGDQVALRFKGVTTIVGNNAEEITKYLRRIGEEDFAGGMARQMDTLGGKFSNLGDAAGSLARSIGKAGLNDLIGDITEELNQATIALDEFIKDPNKLPDWAKVGAFTLFKLKQEFIDLGDVIGATGAILNLEVGPGMFDRLDAILEARREKRQQIEKETEAFVAKLEGIGKPGNAAPAAPALPPPATNKGRPRDSRRDLETAEEYGKYMYELARQAYPDATQSAEEYGQAMAKLVVEQTKTVNDAYIDRLAAAEQVVRDNYTATDTFTDAMIRLNAQWLTGDISTETYTDGIARAEKAMKDFGNTGTDSMKELIDAVHGWGNEFTNTLADAVMTGKLNFSDLADSIIRDLLRIQIQKGITDSILNVDWKGLFPGGSSPASGATVTPSAGAVIAHAGAIIGQDGGHRIVDASVFHGAPRYHTGGIAGNEVPAILQRGEGVFTQAQMRALGNSSPGELRVILENRGAPKEAQQAQVNFDAKGMVVTIMIDDIQRGGPVSGAMSRTFGLQRGAA
ncbi:MAG: hypothetical protein HY272_02010 [Gammaproteobacteria bacterium]|nr:hypothetical protein [Gammaproteobacteria bacterium]